MSSQTPVDPPTPRLEPPTTDDVARHTVPESVVAEGEADVSITPATDKTVAIRPEGDSTPTAQPSFGRNPTEDYAICGKIGDGGMGIVYLARDRRLGRYVAIKRLNERALADPILRSRFLHEARAVAALNHAYIVHIYALGEDALGPYIVMEYVSGPVSTEVVQPEAPDQPPPKNVTLEQFINRTGPMNAEDAVTMLLKIARTIVYAHSCGVIHRDLKPANILLDPSEEPKLVDFGLARITPRNGGQREEELTVPGEKLISLGYSAPELEQDASTSDGRADIYSLGAILYFLLTGRNPRYYREQDVPTFLREVLRRSLETVREQRYRTAQDFVHALSEAATHGKTVAPTIKTTWRCKWCDAVNPISTKFCAECGWDGSEHCLECGAETFVGQQYCPSCGADGRMYEHVSAIVKQMKLAEDERRFERIASIAGRLHGFEPSGPTGRKILADAQQCVENAERCVIRRNRLATLIPTELKAANYERAQNFIEEFRQLNEDPMVYEEELREIPEQLFTRDLTRVRQCLKQRDWKTARLLIGNMAVKYGTHPEYQEVRNLLLAHDKKRQRIFLGSAIGAFLFLYLLSLPPVARMMENQLSPVARTCYTPARWLSKLPIIHATMNGYARLFGQADGVERYFKTADEQNAQQGTLHERLTEGGLAALPGGAEFLRDDYMKQLETLHTVQVAEEITLLETYRKHVEEFQKEMQQKGEFVSLIAAKNALTYYDEHGAISPISENDPQRLRMEKERFALEQEGNKRKAARQVVMETKKYTAVLNEMCTTYTQQNQLDQAELLTTEIQRVRQSSIVKEAETILAEARKKGHGDSILLSANITNEESNRIAEDLRAKADVLQKALLAQDAAATAALKDWPTQYTAQLKSLMEQFQLAGDYNALSAAADELFRYESTPTLTQELLVPEPEKLRALQIRFLNLYQDVMLTRDRAKFAAYQKFISALEAKQTDYTKKNQLEAASIVNQALRLTLKDPKYITLQQELTPNATPSKPTSSQE